MVLYTRHTGWRQGDVNAPRLGADEPPRARAARMLGEAARLHAAGRHGDALAKCKGAIRAIQVKLAGLAR